MSQCATTREKPTRWATSGRRNTWAPSVPAHALEDNRYDSSVQCEAVEWLIEWMFWNMLKCKICLITFCLFRDGGVRTAADQVQMSMPVCCSLLDMETTPYAKWVMELSYKYISYILDILLSFETISCPLWTPRIFLVISYKCTKPILTFFSKILTFVSEVLTLRPVFLPVQFFDRTFIAP